MLSQTARPVIAATLPVVAQHIEPIAQRFYRHLFSEHPDLSDGTFNRGNQVHAIVDVLGDAVPRRSPPPGTRSTV